MLWGQIQTPTWWHNALRNGLIVFIQLYYCYYKWLVMIAPYCSIADCMGLFEDWLLVGRKKKKRTPVCQAACRLPKPINVDLLKRDSFSLSVSVQLFNSPEKNNMDCGKKYGSPTKNYRLRWRMGKYCPYFQHPGKLCVCVRYCVRWCYKEHMQQNHSLTPKWGKWFHNIAH